jgi:dipeptide/tripeptide permease
LTVNVVGRAKAGGGVTAESQIAVEIESLSNAAQIMATLFVALAIEERSTSLLRRLWSSNPLKGGPIVLGALIVPIATIFSDSIYIIDARNKLDPPEWLFSLNKFAIGLMAIILGVGLMSAIFLHPEREERRD